MEPSSSVPATDALPSIKSLINSVYSSFDDVEDAAEKLPTDFDFSYYMNFKPFKKAMASTGDAALSLAQKVLEGAGFAEKAAKLRQLDDEELLECVSDVTDTLLERVDSCLDEIRGVKNNQETSVIKYKERPYRRGRWEPSVPSDSGLARPQLAFVKEIDNSNTPFVPRLTTKPNALTPFGASQTRDTMSPDLASHLKGLGVAQRSLQRHTHPYENEIEQLEYVDWMLQPNEERMYPPLESTPCTWVDTVAQLEDLCRVLNAEKEIAVDLEQHSYRSFQGLTCLMQISTRSQDFLIDPFKLRQEMHRFNTSFTNPAIVKVFHGADSDIVWLQRDFGVYVVNMFDTGQAARALDLPSFGLAYLLKTYCNLDVDKKYQLADWRVRPLPSEMERYAREDTHYLLYVYDRLKNELIERSSGGQAPASNGAHGTDLLRAVLHRSRQLCLRMYEKQLFSEDAYLALYNRYNVPLTSQQLRVFAALFKWRDQAARENDESHGYVLPNNTLFALAQAVPADALALRRCCGHVTPLVNTNLSYLLELIKHASEDWDEDGQQQSSANGTSVPAIPSSSAATLLHQTNYLDLGPTRDDDETPRPASSLPKLPEPIAARQAAVMVTAKVAVRSSVFGGGSDEESDDGDETAHGKALEILSTFSGALVGTSAVPFPETPTSRPGSAAINTGTIQAGGSGSTTAPSTHAPAQSTPSAPGPSGREEVGQPQSLSEKFGLKRDWKSRKRRSAGDPKTDDGTDGLDDTCDTVQSQPDNPMDADTAGMSSGASSAEDEDGSDEDGAAARADGSGQPAWEPVPGFESSSSDEGDGESDADGEKDTEAVVEDRDQTAPLGKGIVETTNARGPDSEEASSSGSKPTGTAAAPPKKKARVEYSYDEGFTPFQYPDAAAAVTTKATGSPKSTKDVTNKRAPKKGGKAAAFFDPTAVLNKNLTEKAKKQVKRPHLWPISGSRSMTFANPGHGGKSSPKGRK